MRPATRYAPSPCSGMTAIEFEPAFDRVQRPAVGRQRDREGRRPREATARVIVAIVVAVARARQQAGRTAGVDLGDDGVAGRVDDGDLVGVVLRHEQPRAGRVQGHPQRVAVQLDALDQVPGRRRADVDGHDLAVAVRRHVGDAVPLDDDGEREGAAGGAVDAFVVGEERPQVVLVAHGAGRRVDHADRIVVVVGHDQRLAVARDAQAGRVRADADADAVVRVPQRDRRPPSVHVPPTLL